MRISNYDEYPFMQPHYDTNAGKKPTNLSINSDLLQKAKALNINLSSTLEQALNQRLAEVQNVQWKKRNRRAIQVHGEVIEAQGCFSDAFRTFAKE